MQTELLLDELIEPKAARAKREWNEAWSSLVTAGRTWRILATVEGAALLVAIFGLIYLGHLPKQVPYVVSLDKVGNAGYVGKPSSMSAATWGLVREQAIRQFITNWRTVTSDQSAQVLDYQRAFCYIGSGSPANAFLTAWYADHDPIQRALKGESVSVRMKTAERESDNTIGVWFEETDSPGAGQPPTRKLYRARVTYAMHIPTSELARAENPLGVLITELAVEEVHE